MENQNPITDLENQPVFTRHTSTAHVPIFSVILIFKIQTSENTPTLPSSDTSNFDSISDDDLSIALRKSKRTCTISLDLYLIHTYLLSFMLLYFSLDSYSVSKSISEAIFISIWKDTMKEKMLTLEHILLFFLQERKQLNVDRYTL